MSRSVVSKPIAEYRPDGLAVAERAPRLSWHVLSDTAERHGFEVEVRWADGTTESCELGPDAGVFTAWPFRPLNSRERAAVRVRALETGAVRGAWSDALSIEGALFDASDWEQPFVVASEGWRRETRPSFYLRAEFELAEPPRAARLHVTGHGVFIAHLNGSRVSDEHLAPGWTSYTNRVRSRTHDVTGALVEGSNALGFEVADGWYRGNIGFDGGLWDVYGEHVGVLAQLEVAGADGAWSVIPLEGAWRVNAGSSTSAGLYEGEAFDARLVPHGWNSSDFDASTWAVPALLPAGAAGNVEPAVNVPVRPIEELAPISVTRTANGRHRIDFGQNISGVVELRRIRAAAGSVLRIHHAEVLEDGELGTRPLRRAVSIDSYTSDGSEATWRPRFTIHGFRYAEVEGWEGEFGPDNVAGIVIHTAMERRGWFESSDELLNQLHENVVWSMRDNFVDLPTDCPQRDERMGWTGDIQVFAPAAEYLYDCDGVLASWLRDVAVEQRPTGAVPNFVPWVECGFPSAASTAWGDAAVIVPWTMYQRRGDLGVLARQWPSMVAWVEHLRGRIGPEGVVAGSMELGDWLDPAAPADDPAAARTDRYLVATAYVVKSSRILSEAGVLLGYGKAAEAYALLAAETTSALRRTFFADDESVSHAPTAMALAIAFDLVDDAQRARLGNLLAASVRAAGFAVQTGFVGTPIICDALSSTGHIDEAYGLLLRRECPSWLYPVTMGATTAWERWDSMLPDGSINPGDMTSFNHYALGAVVDFLHRVVAGLAPAAPGYRVMSVRPRPGAGLTSAAARHITPLGEAAVSWRIVGDAFELEVTVPAGATAEVTLPDPDATSVGLTHGTHYLTCAAPPLTNGVLA